jgi:hypothetical protein
MAKVRARFGSLQKDIKSSPKQQKTASILKTMDNLNTHIFNLEKNVDISDTARFLVNEDERV